MPIRYRTRDRYFLSRVSTAMLTSDIDFFDARLILSVCMSVRHIIIIIIIIIQHLYSAIMSYADTEALVAPVKSE